MMTGQCVYWCVPCLWWRMGDRRGYSGLQVSQKLCSPKSLISLFIGCSVTPLEYQNDHQHTEMPKEESSFGGQHHLHCHWKYNSLQQEMYFSQKTGLTWSVEEMKKVCWIAQVLVWYMFNTIIIHLCPHSTICWKPSGKEKPSCARGEVAGVICGNSPFEDALSRLTTEN